MKKVIAVLLLSVLTTTVFATKLETYFNDCDDFFKKYVRDGKVNYAGVKQNLAEIESLISQASTMSLSATPNVRNKAFFINAYNLLVIRNLAKRYPVLSTKNLPGFFDKKKYQVAKTYYTLDELEYYCLVRPYKDNRIHFVLVPGAQGSPKIANYAIRPETVEDQMDTRTKITLNNSEYIQVDKESKTVLVSEIFKDHKGAFIKEGKTVIDFINEYRNVDNQIPTDYSLDYYPYNWRINK